MFFTEDDISGIESVLSAFYSNIEKRYTIEELSRMAGMSPTRFKLCFKWYTGNAVFNFQKIYRMNMAYIWVTTTRYSLDKIALKCGFVYLTHFNAAFAKMFLIRPFRLRKLLKLG